MTQDSQEVEVCSDAPAESARPKRRTAAAIKESAKNRRKYERRKARTEAQREAAADFSQEIKPEEAKEILAEVRGLRNQRVIDVCVELAKVAARTLRLSFNRHLFTHGVQKTIEAASGIEVTPPDVEDVWNPGERIRLHELWALWDYSTAWRVQPDGSKITFDQFREMRRKCITDVMWFGNTVLGKEFEDEPHGRWGRELFIQKNPDLLPEKITWPDIKAALTAQSPIRQRLLIASRSSFKSTYNTVDLLSWVLCFAGNIRIMCCTSTRKLSSRFLGDFKAYWLMKVNEPTLFNQLWPDAMLWPGEEGPSTSFTSPLRTLDLIQPTFFNTSLDSEGQAGERADLYVSEDVAEITNSSSPEQREKTLLKWDMLRELLEPFGYLQVVGTPISSGTGQADDPGDIYSVLLAREAAREAAGEEKQMLSMICPCWTVKEGVNKLPYDKTLTEDEVDLLFQSRLSFRYLMSKLRESEKVFRQQSLCSWVPDEEEELRCHFTEDLVRATMCPRSSVPAQGLDYIFWDTASSASRYADYSAGCVCRVVPKNAAGHSEIYVMEVVFDRFVPSALATAVVFLAKRWPSVHQTVIEKTAGSELLRDRIYMEANKYGVPLRLSFRNPRSGPNAKDAKLKRVKETEILMVEKRFHLVNGIWSDEVMNQYLNFTTGVSTKLKKDDCADVIGACIEAVLPKGQTMEDKELSEEEKLKLKEDYEAAQRAHWHNAIFGNHQQIPVRTEEPEDQPRTPFGIPGLRPLKR
jgi:phage terminase large subunit-like protein